MLHHNIEVLVIIFLQFRRCDLENVNFGVNIMRLTKGLYSDTDQLFYIDMEPEGNCLNESNLAVRIDKIKCTDDVLIKPFK